MLFKQIKVIQSDLSKISLSRPTHTRFMKVKAALAGHIPYFLSYAEKTSFF